MLGLCINWSKINLNSGNHEAEGRRFKGIQERYGDLPTLKSSMASLALGSSDNQRSRKSCNESKSCNLKFALYYWQWNYLSSCELDFFLCHRMIWLATYGFSLQYIMGRQAPLYPNKRPQKDVAKLLHISAEGIYSAAYCSKAGMGFMCERPNSQGHLPHHCMKLIHT